MRTAKKSPITKTGRKKTELKLVLENLYAKYNHRHLVKPDPLQFLYRYSKRADVEIVALLASGLAYGRVRQIERSLSRLFEYIGKSPSDFVLNFDSHKRSQLRDFRHRFTAGDDISNLFELLKDVCDRFGGIEKFFARGYDIDDINIIPALSRFCESLSSMYADRHKDGLSGGLKYLLASPARGSACKRLNLFLRWMVRDDDVDPGLWKSVDKAKLLVPVDVHMGRLCKILGLYDRKTINLSAAVEITESFVEIESADPVKYDFALSRIGIVENCDGSYRPECGNCELLGYCGRREHG
ncbi:MAG: TIGR02757 family protein [Phycisphaerales bacterium]|nr:MAG: TIGR02757 family protein [Phycisphaerales bacterium]